MNTFGDRLAKTGWYAHRIHDAPPTQFQVLGERACGTNVVRKLIEKAWTIERTEGLGWKHASPCMVAIPKRLLVVCVQRSVFGWAKSLYKRPWHADVAMQRLPFSEFIRSEWRGIVDRSDDFEMLHEEIKVDGQPLQLDRHPITGKAYENIFAMRNTKSAALLNMQNRDCDVMYVQLEAVQNDPKAFVMALGAAFDLTSTPRGFSPVKRRLGTRFNPSVKSREAPPEYWSPEDRVFALAQLDMSVENAWGYRYKTSAKIDHDASQAAVAALMSGDRIPTAVRRAKVATFHSARQNHKR